MRERERELGIQIPSVVTLHFGNAADKLVPKPHHSHLRLRVTGPNYG